MQIGVVYFVMATKGRSDSLPLATPVPAPVRDPTHMQYAALLHIHMAVHYRCGGYLTLSSAETVPSLSGGTHSLAWCRPYQ